MHILVLDCCGPSCGVGVWENGALSAFLSERMERGQDARLMPMICTVMKNAEIGFEDLDRIAVTRGPGSFTGTRVGLAAARGIGLALGKSVVGIDRFSIHKSLYGKEKNLLVVIDSKRAELFCKFFHAAGDADGPCMMTEEEIDTFLATHPDTDRAGDFGVPEDERVLAACAALAAAADTKHPDFQPSPLYIRPPDVTVAKKA